MTSSTGLPALTISQIRRGRSRLATSSWIDLVGSRLACPLLAFSAIRRSVTEPSRFQTATLNPWSAMLSARFLPMTASPSIPMFAFCFSLICVRLLNSASLGDRNS